MSTLITDSRLEADFSGLDLTGEVDYDGVRFVGHGVGTRLGKLVALYKVIESAIQHGSRTELDRYDNRDDFVIQLAVEASDSEGLARGTSMLFKRCGRRGTLRYVPPDAVGPATLFQAYTSVPEFAYDDMDELRLQRVYTLKLECDPFGYSENEVISEAFAAAASNPTSATISDGSSAAGWSGDQGTTVTASGGKLRQTLAPAEFQRVTSDDGRYSAEIYSHVQTIRRVFDPAVDFTGTRHVTAVVETTAGDLTHVRALVTTTSGAVIEPRAYGLRQVSPTRTDGTWLLPDDVAVTAVTSVAFETYVRTTNAPLGAAERILIDDVTRTSAPPQTSSGRESYRRLQVYGSAPTPASWTIEHETQGLGETWLYTAPVLGDRGYTPDLRRHLDLTSINVDPDADAVSGSTARRGNGTYEFNVPTALLAAGRYLLVLRAGLAANAQNPSGVWTASVSTRRAGGAIIGTEQVIGTRTVPRAATAALPMTSFGMVTLPLVQVSPVGSRLLTRISIAATADSVLDQAWLYWMGPGAALTSFRAGTQRRARITNASMDSDASFLIGTAADFSDAYHPAGLVDRWGQHLVEPDEIDLHIVTTVATNPRVRMRHRPAWADFAAWVPTETDTGQV